MTQSALVQQTEVADWPTVWGLKPIQLHDQYWACRGVQVVQLGTPSDLHQGAELFLLVPAHSLVLFNLAVVIDMLSWMDLKVLFVKLRNDREDRYREIAVADEYAQFQSFQRVYEKPNAGEIRIALTPDIKIAELWQRASTLCCGWEQLLRATTASDSATISPEGSICSAVNKDEVIQFVHELACLWKRPDVTIQRASRAGNDIWIDKEAIVESGAKLVGPVWVGAGRNVPDRESVVGPAVLWDDPASRPPTGALTWEGIESPQPFTEPGQSKKDKPVGYAGKRLFDIVFSLLILILCLPLFPLVMLAIWLDDGRPFFFAHRRETFGGKEFSCIKFRSMRRDAEAIKAELMEQNQIDGPQFYMENDPRLLRLGSFMRKTNLDELPQFINVLLGQMSIVGPRPSPYDENQYCPSWREARLSVRPGITGMWQVKRTREEGLDFQEWIKYDIEYVENASFRLDLWIIWKTVELVFVSIWKAFRRDKEDKKDKTHSA